MNLFEEFQKAIQPFWGDQRRSIEKSADGTYSDDSEEEDKWKDEAAWLAS